MTLLARLLSFLGLGREASPAASTAPAAQPVAATPAVPVHAVGDAPAAPPLALRPAETPMTPTQFRAQVIEPGAAWTEDACGLTSSVAARRILLAIAIQESDLRHRRQVLANGAPGPAKSFWQGERTGGMILVVTSSKISPSIRSKGEALCRAAGVEPLALSIWNAIEHNDLLAYGLARLLLLSDPNAIPETEAGAWACYADRLWRPGRPHRERWVTSWAQAVREYPLGG